MSAPSFMKPALSKMAGNLYCVASVMIGDICALNATSATRSELLLGWWFGKTIVRLYVLAIDIAEILEALAERIRGLPGRHALLGPEPPNARYLACDRKLLRGSQRPTRKDRNARESQEGTPARHPQAVHHESAFDTRPCCTAHTATLARELRSSLLRIFARVAPRWPPLSRALRRSVGCSSPGQSTWSPLPRARSADQQPAVEPWRSGHGCWQGLLDTPDWILTICELTDLSGSRPISGRSCDSKACRPV